MNDDGEAMREQQFTEAQRAEPYSCARCQGDIEWDDSVWVEVAGNGGSKPYHIGCEPDPEVRE